MRRVNSWTLLTGLVVFVIISFVYFNFQTPLVGNAWSRQPKAARILKSELEQLNKEIERVLDEKVSAIERRLLRDDRSTTQSASNRNGVPEIREIESPVAVRQRQNTLQEQSVPSLNKYSKCASRYPNNEFLKFVINNERFRGKKIFLAANLFESHLILADWLIELERTIQFLGPENVFVSVYESGSRDSTAAWLIMFRNLMTKFDVEHRIVSGGHVVRHPNSHRIEFLATVRNAAMEPLYESKPGTYEFVVYMNDVFYCAEDVLRLLMYRADMACGLDFTVAAWHSDGQQELTFYDTWVALDVAGEIFESTFPYVADMPNRYGTRQRIQQGKAFPAMCCWNGLVSIRAEVFYKGIRFRRGYKTKTECSACECQLICKDMWAYNYTKILIDPMVQVTYQESSLKALGSYRKRHFPASYPPLSASEPHPEDAMVPVFNSVKYATTWACCGLEGTGNHPDTGCHYYYTEIHGATAHRNISSNTLAGANVAGAGKVRYDQRCGEFFPAPDGGEVSICDNACCSASGWCGVSEEHCCPECTDYRNGGGGAVAKTQAKEAQPKVERNEATTLYSKGWIVDISNTNGKTRPDLRCGFAYRAPDNSGPAICHNACCSLSGWCGTEEEHCCDSCGDFRLDRALKPLQSPNFPVARLSSKFTEQGSAEAASSSLSPEDVQSRIDQLETQPVVSDNLVGETS